MVVSANESANEISEDPLYFLEFLKKDITGVVLYGEGTKKCSKNVNFHRGQDIL
jgi:hypothetical protein